MGATSVKYKKKVAAKKTTAEVLTIDYMKSNIVQKTINMAATLKKYPRPKNNS